MSSLLRSISARHSSAWASTALSPARTLTWSLRRSIHSSSPRREHYIDVDEQQFKRHVLQGGSKPVLVDFYADWCKPCKMISPLLENITSDSSLAGGKELDLVTVDTERQFEIAKKYSITALPTVIAFKDGKQVKHFVGAVKMDVLQKFVADL